MLLFPLLYNISPHDILERTYVLTAKAVHPDDLSKKAHIPEAKQRASPSLAFDTLAPLRRLSYFQEVSMETRIALIGIILESRESVDELNHLLSKYGEYVIGRMGIPYREKGIHVISVAMDAPNNIISALSGRLGMLPGVSTKTIYGKNI